MGCRTADFLINNHWKETGAPPFISLILLDEAVRNRSIERTRKFLDGQPNKLKDLFLQFRNLAAWLVTHSLSEKYGSADHAVYWYIANIFGIPMESQQHRNVLFNAFIRQESAFGSPLVETTLLLSVC